MRIAALTMVAATLLHGCGDVELSMGGKADRCADNGSTIALEVTPISFARGDSTTVGVHWSTYVQLAAPVVATLLLGPQQEIEVDFELTGQDSASEHIYSGALLNPFGMGAPTGSGAVVATARANEGCRIVPTATTSFELE